MSEEQNKLIDASTIEAVNKALTELEGNEKTSYVPMSGGEVTESSGVTIAKGVDVGQRSNAEIDAFPISEENKKKLKKFSNAKGAKALELFNEHGAVTLSDPEVEALNKHIADLEYKSARKNYEAATGKDFYALPTNVRNALVVASFQLGNKLYKDNGKQTNFAKELKAEDYEAAADNMATWNINSKDGLQKRYRAQADLLRGDISVEELNNRAAVHLSNIRSGEFYDLKTDKYKNRFADKLTTTQPEQTSDRTYVIKPGDNLTQIAAREGTAMEQIMRANAILDRNSIQAGQEIIIPGTGPSTVPEEEQDALTLAIQDAYESAGKDYDYSKSQIASFLSRY